jgi:hypothetical protein
MIHTDEDDEFARIERENNFKGQPYHFKPKSEWKELTEKEVVSNFGRYYSGDTWFIARDLEAYIRNKNK